MWGLIPNHLFLGRGSIQKYEKGHGQQIVDTRIDCQTVNEPARHVDCIELRTTQNLNYEKLEKFKFQRFRDSDIGQGLQ